MTVQKISFSFWFMTVILFLVLVFFLNVRSIYANPIQIELEQEISY